MTRGSRVHGWMQVPLLRFCLFLPSLAAEGLGWGGEDKLEVQPVHPGLGGGVLTALGAGLLWPGMGVGAV